MKLEINDLKSSLMESTSIILSFLGGFSTAFVVFVVMGYVFVKKTDKKNQANEHQ